MQKNKLKQGLSKEDGGVLSYVLILVLTMTLLASASMTLAKTQLAVSRTARHTSNSYHLARSGAEKMVDNINKELAMELPRLMKQANKETRSKLIGSNETEESDGLIYRFQDVNATIYDGRYLGKEYNYEYKNKLKELIYQHIKVSFKEPISYQASSDLKEGTPITITSRLSESDLDDKKEAFMVEVTAQAKKDDKIFTKARVQGIIALEDLTEEDQLLEEYEWATKEGKRIRYPEALQAPVISFGDFVLAEGQQAEIEGDLLVKGSTKEWDYNGNVPETDQQGGVLVPDGASLEITDNAFVLSNIQTISTYQKEEKNSQITIKGDAIANTIAINDSYYEGHKNNTNPWDYPNKEDKITIGRNAYVDNDIRIDRYVEDATIEVKGSVFGISDGPSNNLNDQIDPNKSSGVFSLGKNSIIKMGRAFIAGQAFINFGDGHYHRLYESAGEPFQDVYYLEQYREQFGHSDQYLEDLKGLNLINTKNIIVSETNGDKPQAYAPARISGKAGPEEEGQSYDVSGGIGFVSSGAEARKLFYAGYETGKKPGTGWQEVIAAESDFKNPILGTDIHWGDIIIDPLSFYQGTNPYKKKYLEDVEAYDKTIGYKGLQGYMLAKRGVFYQEDAFPPQLRTFEDLIDLGVFANDHPWSYNNPIHIISGTETIDISKFKEIPTAIICRNREATISLEGSGIFNGIIISPGKVEITSQMEINGSIIAGNEDQGGSTRESLISGDHAGIHIKASGVKINHDPDMLLTIGFMDKSLQRQLYDCLKLTNYKGQASGQSTLNDILGEEEERILQLSQKSVISSKQGGFQFTMKSLGKVENNVDN